MDDLKFIIVQEFTEAGCHFDILTSDNHVPVFDAFMPGYKVCDWIISGYDHLDEVLEKDV